MALEQIVYNTDHHFTVRLSPMNQPLIGAQRERWQDHTIGLCSDDWLRTEQIKTTQVMWLASKQPMLIEYGANLHLMLLVC